MSPRRKTPEAGAAQRAGNVSFADALVQWQKQQGRHDLPWQGTRDPYRIWLSEIMLQQTQVATVIPYYARFLERFPDVAALAAAPAADVMALWSGLGYYTRARNLHRCAQQVVIEHGGRFPTDPAALQSLPGIGRSTAAAIAVFSSGIRAAILDGNVKRVLARVFGIAGYPGERIIEQSLWSLAESLLPIEDTPAYTQGLMDLGATVCVRSRPRCAICPMAAQCVALATDRTDTLPTRKPRKALPEKHVAMLVVTHRKQVLLVQRPDTGIWGGLLSLPEIESNHLRTIKRHAAAFGEIDEVESLPPFTHTFTHFKLHVVPYAISLKRRAPLARESQLSWHRLDGLDRLGLPAPVRKLLLGAGKR